MVRVSYDSALESALRKKLDEATATTTESMTSGYHETLAAYREGVGYLRALKDIRDWMADIKTQVQKG